MVSLSAGGGKPSLRSVVSADSFMVDFTQSPSPFFRSVVAVDAAAAASFLLLPAAVSDVAPSLAFLLGAMEFGVEWEKVVSFEGK